MKHNYHWEKIPAEIISIKKEKGILGILSIEAVLKARNSDEEEYFTVTWVYAPSIKTSNKMYGNYIPKCFFWAYEHAEIGQEVFLHHCLDDNSKYFYCC